MSLEHKVRQIIKRTSVDGAGNSGYVLEALRRAAQRPTNQNNTLSSPPTITVSASNGGAAMIAGSVRVAWNDAKITYGTRVSVSGVSGIDATIARVQVADVTGPGVATVLGGVASSYSFETTDTAFVVPAKGYTKIRTWIDEGDGVWCTTPVQTMPSDGTLYGVLYDFGGSRKPRKVIVEFAGQAGGLWIAATGSIAKWQLSEIKLQMEGDSFTENTGATNVFTGYSNRFSQELGLLGSLINSALGGTGWLKANASPARKSARERVVASVIDNAPDVLVWGLGLNDDVDVSVASGDCFDLVHQALPACIQIAFSPFQPRTIAGVVPRRNEIAAACAARPWITFIDLSSVSAAPEITGTGRVGATTGTGNSDWVISADNTHPVQEGHEYLAMVRAAALRKALKLA